MSASTDDENEDLQTEKDPDAIIQEYLQENRLPLVQNPLQYWMVNQDKWPGLSKIAQKYLSAPLGSVASEREFKKARDITSGDRSRLLPENAERLLFMKYNLFALGYKVDINLPADPPMPGGQ